MLGHSLLNKVSACFIGIASTPTTGTALGHLLAARWLGAIVGKKIRNEANGASRLTRRFSRNDRPDELGCSIAILWQLSIPAFRGRLSETIR